MSKLQNRVRALPSSAFFLARTANCLWKASLDRVKPFLWFFSTMASDELQSVSEMEPVADPGFESRGDVRPPKLVMA